MTKVSARPWAVISLEAVGSRLEAVFFVARTLVYLLSSSLRFTNRYCQVIPGHLSLLCSYHTESD